MTMKPKTRPKALADVPRWAVLAAHAVPLLVLPSGLWRIALGLGAPVVQHADTDPGTGGLPYLVALTALSELLAFLTLGLVRSWGEVFPRWIPFLGGRNVSVSAATATALAGAAGLYGLMGWYAYAAYAGLGGPDGRMRTDALQEAVFAGCYLPLVAWPVLLTAVAIAYHRRRTGRYDGAPRTGRPAASSCV
ncbi:hypothetical protein [Streptomyces vilmorinianum]|uniref:hypothetical protein n=1 Tax=Streptomyces vilmorinianum TaxID=3051092 RepID=UPI0020C79C95|nr:hypothetical protein [Streptomyces vilmorinianum]